jgi:integrase
MRERKRAPMSSRTAAVRSAESREHILFQRLMNPAIDEKPPKEVPRLREFAKAVEWEVIDRMPCAIKLPPVPKSEASFYNFVGYERLVEAARMIDWRTHLVVLLGGDAGLRCGEMIALEWCDVDLVARQLCVRQSDWNGPVSSPGIRTWR